MSKNGESKAKHANHEIDETIDDTFSAVSRVNGQAAKLIQSPQERKKAWGSAKKSPLAYSFALFQLIGSFIPLSLTAGFVFFAAVSTLVATGIAFSLAFCAGLAVLVPVLIFTIPATAVVWLMVVGTLTAADWIYRNFYIDSGFKAKVSELTDEAVQEYSEIEENAAKEYEAYKKRVVESGQEAKERGSRMYEDASYKAGQAYDQVGQKAGQLKQKTIEAGDNAADEISAEASEWQRSGSNIVQEGRHNANAVKKKGDELADQTKVSTQNMANTTKRELNH